MAVATSARGPARQAQAPDGEGRRTSWLRIVSPARLARRTQQRRARSIVLLASASVVGVCLFVASAQAVVASQQVRIDTLQQSLATAVTTNEGLEVDRAALTAPARILQLAERRLGMVAPASVTYLAPVDPGPPASSSGGTGAK